MKPIVVRLPWNMGRILYTPDTGEARFGADQFFLSNLQADLIRGGSILKSFNLGSGVVTDAGVAFMADDFLDGSSSITTFDYHATGIGTGAAVVGDTTLENVTGAPARVAGTPTNPTAPQYRSVATVSYTSGLAITEWGLFDAASAGTLWDRRVFGAINVVNGDSIQFTYTLTINSGG